MKRFFLILCPVLLPFVSALGQPSEYRIQGNLNELDSTAIALIASNDFYKLGKVIIDEQTDLSRVYLLQGFSNLKIDLRLKQLPKGFGRHVFDSARSLTVHCNGLVEDLQFLKAFSNLHTLYLHKLNLVNLPQYLTRLKHLEWFSVSSEALLNVDVLGKMISLRRINLTGSRQLSSLPRFSKKYQVYSLTIGGSSQQFDFTGLSTCNRLTHFTTWDIDYAAVPTSLPHSVRYVYVYDNATLSNLEKLEQLPYLKGIVLEGVGMEQLSLSLPHRDMAFLKLKGNESLAHVKLHLATSCLEELELLELPALTILEADLQEVKIGKLSIHRTGLRVLPLITPQMTRVFITDNRQLQAEEVTFEEAGHLVVIRNNGQDLKN